MFLAKHFASIWISLLRQLLVHRKAASLNEMYINCHKLITALKVLAKGADKAFGTRRSHCSKRQISSNQEYINVIIAPAFIQYVFQVKEFTKIAPSLLLLGRHQYTVILQTNKWRKSSDWPILWFLWNYAHCLIIQLC